MLAAFPDPGRIQKVDPLGYFSSIGPQIRGSTF